MTSNFALPRPAAIFEANRQQVFNTTDRLFGFLMIFQFIGAVVAAAILSPTTWAGSRSWIHPHVWTALLLGSTIAGPVVALTFLCPGKSYTRYVVAVCQMLMSALLIHVSGGRIETHFHVFGSLAFLAFYRDWKLLIPATLVVLIDHVGRGIYFPQSVYGVGSGAEWRFLEHAGWVVFEDVILAASCMRGVQEMWAMAQRQAQLEELNAQVEQTVAVKTAELTHSEIRNGAVLEHALDGIITIDPDGRILEFNPASEGMFGRRREEAIGTFLTDVFVDAEKATLIKSEIARYLESQDESGMNKRREFAILRANGEEFPVELALTPIPVSSGTVFTAFIRDISEKKRLEGKLAHAQKMESVGQMAAGVAHEINTPNQYIGDNIQFVIDGFSDVKKAIGGYQELRDSAASSVEPELLQKVDEIIKSSDLEYLADEIPKALSQAQEGVERVGSIVRAMKEFSHPGVDAWTAVDVNRVVESTITVSRHEWKYVAITEVSLDRNLPLTSGHPGELGQVILNLVVNAAHAIAERYQGNALGRIGVTTRHVGQYIEIEVKDDGCGIPEHVRPRVFDPFFTTKGVGIGTGQGLAISHAVIVERHGGELLFESELGKGSTFTIRLLVDAASEKHGKVAA